ncbi:MAG: hypothetical protein ACP5VE_08775 [Chthonomonadales bacterium]
MLHKAFLLLVVAVAGGCSFGGSAVLGHPHPGPIVPVSRLKPSPRSVTIRGAMVEKCPVAGCWFILRDATGAIKVDTKAAGFTVTDVPVNTVVTVSGRVTGSGQPVLAADGVRY